MILKIVALITLLLTTVCRSAIATDYTYTEIVASPLPFRYLGEGYGISGHGSAAGYFSDTFAERPFLYDGAFKYLGDERGKAFDINNSNHVVGFDTTFGPNFQTIRHAFLYDGTMHDLGTFGGQNSSAYGINNDGLVTGAADLDIDRHSYHAFLYDGVMHDIGTLGGDFSIGTDVNASGHVTGDSTLLGDGLKHAFLYDGVTMKDLGTLGGPESRGLAINDLGHVVGVSLLSADPFSWHAFFYDGTMMHNLGHIFPSLAFAPYPVFLADINNHDQIVMGRNIWSPTTGWHELPFLETAAGINDAGQIIGIGRDVGIPQAVLLTPIPEPLAAALMVIAVVVGRVLAPTLNAHHQTAIQLITNSP